jgi:hypothetical protein
MLTVERLGRPEVHGNAMLDHPILVQNLIQDFQRPAAVDHVVFRDNLEPIDHRLFGEDVGIVWDAQADSDPVIRKPVETIGRHPEPLRKVELEKS